MSMSTRPWLDELNAKWGDPKLNYSEPVDLHDRLRCCWVWFPDGDNHNVALDEMRDGSHVVRVGRPGAYLKMELRCAPTDDQVRAALVAVGMLAAEVPA
jgi:hypothetical protein